MGWTGSDGALAADGHSVFDHRTCNDVSAPQRSDQQEKQPVYHTGISAGGESTVCQQCLS